MRSHVDWITFTMSTIYRSSYPEGFSLDQVYETMLQETWEHYFEPTLLQDAFGGTWSKNEYSRAPYTDAWSNADRGITLFASQTLNHCTVEISGQGCEALIAKGVLDKVLQQVHSRVTRIDVACDIETEIKPTEFVETRTHKRMMSGGYQSSKTGETVYIGSQKSDRYARVYRYNKPHPRAHLLRVEHVFRKAYAKSVAKALLEDGLDSVSKSAGAAFGWKHDVWDAHGDSDTDISIVYEKRATGKTVFWLVNSVAPAFKRLCEDGTITDPEAFLQEYFLEVT